MEDSKDRGGQLVGATIGLLLVTFVVSGSLESAWSDILLWRNGIYANGLIIEADEDFDEMWFHHAVYEFKTQDGRKITGVAKGDGRLRADLRELKAPVPVIVEYLPNRPAVSQPRLDRRPQSAWSLGLRLLIPAAVVLAWLVLGYHVIVHLHRKYRARPPSVAA